MAHEEAEIQCKVLRCGKNLAFSKDTCLEKERVWWKVTPRKVGLKRRREPSKRRLGWRLAWWGSTEKKEASHLLRQDRPRARPGFVKPIRDELRKK